MAFTSEHKGVYYSKDKKRWIARVMTNGEQHYLGSFVHESDAVKAYEAGVPELVANGDTRHRSSSKKRPVFPRDENGMITRICPDCGRVDKFEQAPRAARCKSCGVKESFRHRPAVGTKTIEDLDQAIKEYEAGASLAEVASTRGVSAMTLRAKMIGAGYQPRTASERVKLANQKHGNADKARAKVRALCETGNFQIACSARHQGIPVEQWQGFVTPENKRLCESPEYREWQRAVFVRDDFACRLCEARGCELHAHHILPKAKYRLWVAETGNGIALCPRCHYSTFGHEEELAPGFRRAIHLPPAIYGCASLSITGV